MAGEVRNKMLSSANKFMSWGLSWRGKPVILGWDLILSASGSIRRLKIEGDRGHPCLVPLDMAKGIESIFDV